MVDCVGGGWVDGLFGSLVDRLVSCSCCCLSVWMIRLKGCLVYCLIV